MSRGSKRKNTGNDALISKKPKISAADTLVRRDLLERCYARVSTLREHIISKLPSSSRLRRRKISSLGRSTSPPDLETHLAHVLDTSLVCPNVDAKDTEDTRWQQWLSFSQKGDESYVSISNGINGSIYSQSEVCMLYFTRRILTKLVGRLSTS
jgi:telomerase reverse transcriptase